MENEKETLGQPEIVPVETDNTLDGPKTENLGKFASTDELARAYENLHAEFTRKSQVLANLQQGNVSVTDEETSPKVEDANNREEVIKEYLISLSQKQYAPTVITGSSDLVLGVKPEPMHLRDIERVAENYFKTKETQK